MLDLRRHFPSKFGHFLIKWDRTARQGAPVFFMAFSVAPGSAGLQVQVQGDFRAVQSLVDRLPPAQVNKRMAIAINKTLGQARSEVRVEMARVFDRPTRWTLDSLALLPAGKRQYSGASRPLDKEAEEGVLIFKGEYGDLANRERVFMRTQIGGGARNLKPFERRLRNRGILPAGYVVAPGSSVPLDQHGNVKASEIVKVLAYLQAFNERGYQGNTSPWEKDKLKKGTRRRYGFELFVVQPGATNAGYQLAPGIWRRVRTPFGAALQPWLMFIRPPSYGPRLDFAGIARRVYERDFRGAVLDAFRSAGRAAPL